MQKCTKICKNFAEYVETLKFTNIKKKEIENL